MSQIQIWYQVGGLSSIRELASQESKELEDLTSKIAYRWEFQAMQWPVVKPTWLGWRLYSGEVHSESNRCENEWRKPHSKWSWEASKGRGSQVHSSGPACIVRQEEGRSPLSLATASCPALQPMRSHHSELWFFSHELSSKQYLLTYSVPL